MNAVIAWAKEGNLGPEAGLNHLFFSSLKLETFTFQDLFISGDVDEVLSRGALHQLKWCQVKEEVITGDSFQNPVQTSVSTCACNKMPYGCLLKTLDVISRASIGGNK